MAEVKIRMRVKRGTNADWTLYNPILALGEIGWVSDLGKWFCGNGVDTYSVIMAGDSSNIWYSQKEVEDYVQSQIAGVSSLKTALPYDTNHATAFGNQYTVGTLVYYLGNIYRCIANNDAIIPTNASYWVNLGAGYPLAESPIDWNATSGNSQIINKPTFVESVKALSDAIVSVDNTDPLNPIVQSKLWVDGTTITGTGTALDPIQATATGLVETVSDDGNGVVAVNNTDPINPVIEFKGVSTDGVTLGGDGSPFNPLSSLVTDTYSVLASALDGTPAYLDSKILALDNSILIDNSVASALQLKVIQSPMVVLEGKNTSGGNIDAGDPVYIMGTVGASNILEVGKADASNPNKMPAVGISAQSVSNGNALGIIVSGIYTNITTDPIDGITPSVGKTLYVKAGGGLTTTKPTGTNLIQNVGKVGKVSGGNAGSIIVSNIQRTNDIPNIADTKIWIGNASGVPTAQSLSGDVAMANTGAVTIQNDAVTYAKIQDISATKRLLGRVSAGAGNIEEIELSADGTLGGAGASGSVVSSQAAVKNYVDVAVGTKQDTLVSATNIKSINGNSLLGSGDLTVGVADGDKGDITVSSSGTVWTIDNAVVTEGKQSLSDVTTNDVSTTKHGYVPKAPNDANKFLDGTGAWSIPEGYTLSVQALTSSPTDGQTVYFGQLPKAPVTVAATSKVYIPRAGTIKVCRIYCYSGTAGTNEAWSLYIRLNNSTDTLIQTLSVATNERVFTNTSLNITVAAGDYIEIKGIQPTWGTNPLTTIYGGYVYIE